MIGGMDHVNKDLVISFKKYTSAQNKNPHRLPYIITFDRNGQVLFYFGSEHKRDSTHPQFETLHKEWLKFLDNTKSKKSIVIYEGNLDESKLPSLEKAIAQFGESGAIVYFAREAHIPYVRPEPKVSDESKELLKEYSKEQVAYFYMMRAIASWCRNPAPEDFQGFLQRIIYRNKKELGWGDFDFSFEATVANMHKKIFGREFEVEDKNLIMRAANPMYDLSEINEIARKSSHIRNIAILDCIEGYWSGGYNIFIVYGASHAVMQERAIKDFVAG